MTPESLADLAAQEIATKALVNGTALHPGAMHRTIATAIRTAIAFERRDCAREVRIRPFASIEDAARAIVARPEP